MVTTSKVGVSGVALGVRQVLRTTVAKSSINVAKLCAGVPSVRVRISAIADGLFSLIADAVSA